jgi:hypothetical protein
LEGLIGQMKKVFLFGIATLLQATGAAHAGSYLHLCGNQFFVVWTHSWPAHPPGTPRVTVMITRSDPDGEEWDGKDGWVSKRLIHFNGRDLFFRGRKCEYFPPEEKR